MNIKRTKTSQLVFISLLSVLIAVCSWISVPSVVPFTMQTFGIFASLLLLGGKNGTVSIVVYIMLGLIGVPVFSGFSGGIGIILGTTGGYIIGFLFVGISYWAFTTIFKDNLTFKIIGMTIGQIICYGIGTVWYIFVYTKNTGDVSLYTVLGWCVFPFIIPDLIKMALAILITSRVKKYVRI